jgi:hypothetical protein
MKTHSLFWTLFASYIVFASLSGWGTWQLVNSMYGLKINPTVTLVFGYVVSLMLYLSSGLILKVSIFRLMFVLSLGYFLKLIVFHSFTPLLFSFPYLLWEWENKKTSVK